MVSIFLKTYGDYPKNKVLDFLVTFQEYDYSMKDIAKNSGIGYTTLKSFWKELVNGKIVKCTRKVGKAKMYKLNKENQQVKKFIDFYFSVIEEETKNILEEKLLVKA